MPNIVVVFNGSACFPYPEGRHASVHKAGLLTYSLPNGLPVLMGWTVAWGVRHVSELTATGIVPDFHGVPFSSSPKNLVLQRYSILVSQRKLILYFFVNKIINRVNWVISLSLQKNLELLWQKRKKSRINSALSQV